MTRPVGRGGLFRGAAILAVLAASTLVGCEGTQGADPETVVRTDPAPAYAIVAAKYNERVAQYAKFSGRAVVRIKYVDEKGKERQEQGEGILQIVRPDRMALSVKKAGSTLFWFGGDQERYWLFDVVDKPVVRVGRHEFIARRAADAGLGLDINPREMIRLLGITPLPAEQGKTVWSRNGKDVEVTTTVPSGGSQTLSLEPGTFIPKKIMLSDAAGKLLVSADLENYEPVELIGVGGGRPRAASRVTAVHPASKTEIKLDLAEMTNAIRSETAFDFEVLKKSMSVDRVIDLDKQPSRAAASGKQ